LKTNTSAVDHQKASRTTIALKATTKEKLDKNRAPGQCYDGFISQLVDAWEQVTGRSNNLNRKTRKSMW
jgi:hypothetical protein